MSKVVILWAGKGRRIQSEYNGMHKSLIPLNGEKLILRLLKNVLNAGCKDIIPILGYQSDILLDEINGMGGFSSITPVINPDYEKTNNLYSLMQAESILSGEEFVVVNGDMVFDYRILKKMLEFEGNAVGTDNYDYGYQLDSPRLLIKNDRIYDLGRHRTIEESQGYAIGMYKFSSDFSKDYFELGKKMVKENPNAGYHDPLLKAFDSVVVRPCYTEKYLWMDIDEKADVAKAEKMIIDIERSQKQQV